MKEKPKRLEPDLQTKRKLFLLSGNSCAFPDCSRVIMDMDGNFVGEICHIEAAEKGGERFNKNQTNEQRREFANPMLMCHDHHVVTNDATAYKVSRLRTIKAAHEQPINDFLASMTCKIEDRTRNNSPTYPETLSSCCPGLVEEEWIEAPALIRSQICRLAEVPMAARKLFAIAIRRSKVDRSKLAVSADDIQEACGLSFNEMIKYRQILAIHKLIEDDSDWDGHNKWTIKRVDPHWYFWDDLKAFAEKGEVTLDEVILNLNFCSPRLA